MKTVQDAVNSFRQGLSHLYEKQESDAISSLVLSEVTGYSKAKLKAFADNQLPAEQYEKLSDILIQLKTGKPVQYVLGYAEFYGLRFYVNPAVLIPRPETEELVNWVIESVAKPQPYILDIGTGSGCIAISLKHQLKGATISAADISADALQTAKGNALINQCNIQFIETDILTPDILPLENKLDIIVSNPPYVTESDKAQMHTNVTDFEPHNALFVPEHNPLLFYNAIADFAVKNLNPNGLLFFEINESYGVEVMELLTDRCFINIELRKDLRGKNRMVKAQISFKEEYTA